MSMGSFSAGLSGLSAHASYLSAIGNNLANLNTIGFKASTFTFADLVSQSVAASASNPAQIGLGVSPGAISPIFSQGAIEKTNEPTNMAIQGGGFFMVRTPDGIMYTRAGDFSFDSEGYLVNSEGYYVQGFTQFDPATGLLLTTGQTGDIQIPPGKLHEPVASTEFSALTNLDASAAVGATFTTVLQVIDALGDSHDVTITYTKTGVGAWSYDVSVPGADVSGGTPGTPYSVGTGTLTFDATGALATVNGGAPADVTLTTPAWTNGAAASTLTWDIVDANGAVSHTGFSSQSATSSISRNGSSAGRVSNINVLSDGTIQGTVNPGESVVFAQVALSTFNNPKGLYKQGNNLFVPSSSAGLPNVGIPGTGGRGSIFGAALEQSNVDMAHEFTQMIMAQRGYQANSRAITTSDELLVETLNLKR